jgi:hypothetical protein
MPYIPIKMVKDQGAYIAIILGLWPLLGHKNGLGPRTQRRHHYGPGPKHECGRGPYLANIMV